MMRQLTSEERRVIDELAEHLQPGDRLLLNQDLSQCSVEEVTRDGARLLFHLPGYKRPNYRGQHTYPVSGIMSDCDGAEISVVLYADENNRILELELIKWGEKPLLKPDWGTFRIQYA